MAYDCGIGFAIDLQYTEINFVFVLAVASAYKYQMVHDNDHVTVACDADVEKWRIQLFGGPFIFARLLLLESVTITDCCPSSLVPNKQVEAHNEKYAITSANSLCLHI